MNVKAEMGPGGVNTNQAVINAVRLPSVIKLSWMENADSPTTTPVLDGYFTSGSAYHVMLTLNSVAGKRVGFFFPNVCPSGPRPVQVANDDINCIKLEGTAYTGETTTTDLEASAMRIGSA